MNSLELTLAILKPDVVKVPHIAKHILQTIKNHGFYIVRSKKVTMSREVADRFYEEHKERFFYNRLITTITSEPSQMYILTRHEAVKLWRVLIGPTRVFEAKYTDPVSIRGKYGLTDARNAAHGSDSIESAKREIGIIFPEFRWDEWYRNEAKFFQTGKVLFNKEEYVHKPIL